MLQFENNSLEEFGERAGGVYLADLTELDEFLRRRGRVITYSIPDSKPFESLASLVEKLRDRPLYRLNINAKASSDTSQYVLIILSSRYVHAFSSKHENEYLDGLKAFRQLSRKKPRWWLDFRTLLAMYLFIYMVRDITHDSAIANLMSNMMFIVVLCWVVCMVLLIKSPISLKEKYEHKSFWETKHHDIKMSLIMVALGTIVASLGIPQMVQRLYHKVVDEPVAPVPATTVPLPATTPLTTEPTTTP